MSEADRARRLSVEVRLAQLRAKHGDPEPHPESTPNPDPSWGPVGSLAQQALSADEYAHLMALHNDMLALERSRKDEAVAVRPKRKRPRTPKPSDVTLPVTPVHVV